MAANTMSKLNGAKTSPANGETLLPPKRGMIKAKIIEEFFKSVSQLAPKGVGGKPKAGEGKDQSEFGVFRCMRKARRFQNSSVMDESTIVDSSGANISPSNGGTLLPPKRGMIKAKIMEEFVKSITKLAPKAGNVKPNPGDGGILLPPKRGMIKAKIMEMMKSVIKLAP
ncbi:hypothetical protein ACHQM5_021679 [Ranunculus cassubicifolius]